MQLTIGYKVGLMSRSGVSRVISFVFGAAWWVALPACDGRISQCNELIRVINAEQEPIKEASGSDPAALKKLADALDHVGTKVGEVPVKDQNIVDFRDKYGAMAKELATAARDTATALEDKDAEKAKTAATHMSSFGTRESELVGEINGYCSGKP